MHRVRQSLAVTLFATALVATVLCMDRSADVSQARAGAAAPAQPWVARLTGSLRRAVRPNRLVAEQATLTSLTSSPQPASTPPAEPRTGRVWSPSLFCIPPPLA